MKLSDFDFELPSSAIAQFPVTPRDTARMLWVPRGEVFFDKHVKDLTDFLQPEDVLVLNNSKVIPARLHAMRGKMQVEILLHRRLGTKKWEAFLRPQKRLRLGDSLHITTGFVFKVESLLEGGLSEIVFEGAAEEMMPRIFAHGLMPLPPYIKREKTGAAVDAQSYQTVYAKSEGSVAAPTAGLHFTETLLQQIKNKGTKIVEVTLHVGAGTFQPVKTENVSEHKMHAEWAEISEEAAQAINAARAKGGRVVAVGTTAMRTLESAADESGALKSWQDETRIFITPGYRFKVVDMLLTNFHLPKSTLFMLVSAFVGLQKARAVYAHAIAQGYRFYSYGDACLFDRLAD